MLNLSYVVNGCKKYFLLCIEQFVLMCKKVFTGQTNKHIKECFLKIIISYMKKKLTMYISTFLLFTHVNMQNKNTKCTESTQGYLGINYKK